MPRKSRLDGAGRPSKSTEYEELLGTLLALFDGCGEGLRSHPRLITDVLYVEKTSWMNMPRAVSILQQLYGIDISLSCAYTYTQSCKQGTIQALRHHNTVPLSLQRSTRDVVKNPSINSHYTTTDMQYSYDKAFIAPVDTVVVARDDKAKVHTDSEVVTDHPKAGEGSGIVTMVLRRILERSVTVTTYQFVVKRDVHGEGCLISHVDGTPVNRTRVTGPGLCLVKSTYYEESTAFRHINELLYVMSCERHRSHFVDSRGKLKPNLLLTVDGGGDERPRNKLTKFLTTLLRRTLDLDRVKVQSFAERDSKLHSVERLHSAEGRALSQAGETSSHGIHTHETDEQGLHDDDKMRDNMDYAANQVVERIDGTPFAQGQIQAMRAPGADKWVFGAGNEQCIRDFLRNDSNRHRLRYDFEMKPSGPI